MLFGEHIAFEVNCGSIATAVIAVQFGGWGSQRDATPTTAKKPRYTKTWRVEFGRGAPIVSFGNAEFENDEPIRIPQTC